MTKAVYLIPLQKKVMIIKTQTKTHQIITSLETHNLLIFILEILLLKWKRSYTKLIR